MAWRFPPCSSAGRTVTSNAEVEDREAAGWVEPATVEPSSFPTQGVVLGSQAPVTATGESCQTHSGERPRTRPGTDSLGRYVDLPRHGKHTAYDAPVLSLRDQVERLLPAQGTGSGFATTDGLVRP